MNRIIEIGSFPLIIGIVMLVFIYVIGKSVEIDPYLVIGHVPIAGFDWEISYMNISWAALIVGIVVTTIGALVKFFYR